MKKNLPRILLGLALLVVRAGRRIAFFPWCGFVGNRKVFQGATAGRGRFNAVPDNDGVTRRVPMPVEYKRAGSESLSLAVVRALMGLFPAVVPGYPRERFMSRDVRDDRVPAGKLKGRSALVGTSAPALVELRATPVSETYPGVEVHAKLVAGMLDRTVKRRPTYTLGAEIILLPAVGLVLAFVVPFLTPLQATTSFGPLAGVTALNVALWTTAGLVLPLASGLLSILAMYALNMSYGYFVESRSNRQFAEPFGHDLTPELVDEMAKDPQKYTMEGRTETLTVLCAEIRDFNGISETLQPKALAQFTDPARRAWGTWVRSCARRTR